MIIGKTKEATNENMDITLGDKLVLPMICQYTLELSGVSMIYMLYLWRLIGMGKTRNKLGVALKQLQELEIEVIQRPRHAQLHLVTCCFYCLQHARIKIQNMAFLYQNF